MEQTKYQTINVIIEAGSSGQKDQPFNLDTRYARVTGFCVYEKSGENVGYDCSLGEDNRVYNDFADKRDFIPGSGVPLKDRYKPVDIENNNQTLYFRVRPDVNPVPEKVQLQLVLKLEGEK